MEQRIDDLELYYLEQFNHFNKMKEMINIKINDIKERELNELNKLEKEKIFKFNNLENDKNKLELLKKKHTEFKIKIENEEIELNNINIEDEFKKLDENAHNQIKELECNQQYYIDNVKNKQTQKQDIESNKVKYYQEYQDKLFNIKINFKATQLSVKERENYLFE
jgi:hypothetical protein